MRFFPSIFKSFRYQKSEVPKPWEGFFAGDLSLNISEYGKNTDEDSLYFGYLKSLVTQGHTLKMTSQQMLLLTVQKSETFNHRLDGAEKPYK